MSERTTDTEVPIACTLSNEELSDRRALWQRIDVEIQDRRRSVSSFQITYASSDEVERLLPSLVDAESRCCSFATWRLTRRHGAVMLTVSGPPDGIASLAREFGIAS